MLDQSVCAAELLVGGFESAVPLLELPLKCEHALACREADAKLVDIGRFGQEIVGAGLHSLNQRTALLACSQQNDVGVAGASCRPRRPTELEAVDIRHHPVRDDEVDRVGLHDVQCFPTIRRFRDLIAE